MRILPDWHQLAAVILVAFACLSCQQTASGGGLLADASSNPDGSTTGMNCPNGPLDEPRPNCDPAPIPNTGNKYADCVARINQYRRECQCLPPLDRWKAGEDCADQMAEYDANKDSAHAGFRDNICSPRGRAQNECPGYPGSIYGSGLSIFGSCLQQMWDEGPPGSGGDVHGHYLNMSSQSYSKVACGFHNTGDSIWAVQNFR